MKTVYVVVEVPDWMTLNVAEAVLRLRVKWVDPPEPEMEVTAAFDHVGDLIDWAGVDVVEMARDAMRGSR